MLGTRIRQLRKMKRMTQQELADKLNLAKSTISQYENGINEPDLKTLAKIAEILDTTLDYLAKGNEKDSDQGKQLRIFSTRLRTLRESKGISISEISSKLDRTESFVEKLETSPTRFPGQDVLNKLAEILGVTRDYLCGYTDDPQGYGSGIYDTDPKDLTEMIRTQGPIMFDGETIEDEEDKEKMIELMRLAYELVKKQNKELSSKRRKKDQHAIDGDKSET